ncbi:MAG TPA: porin [Rhizomicrobium sp.]|nr:porin [Rhizomicrobium sp.]
MKVSTMLLTGAALAALIVPVSAVPAAASSSASSTAVSLDQANQRIGELDQRVDALEAELQSAEQRQAADRANMVAPPTVTGWWDNTSISGRMYFDFSNIDLDVNHVRTGTTNGTAFDVKRFYIGIDHKFDDTWSANVTTDFTYDSTTGVNQVFIKKAYLQAKVNDALVFKLGSADMPWIPFMEDVYGFRYVENTLTDRLKDGNSADWGAHVSGKLYDGMLNYALSVVNGAGYKKANIFRTNGPDVEGRVNLNLGNFIVGVGGYDGKFGQQFGTALHHSYTRLDAVAAYVAPTFRIGGEFFDGNNVSSVTSATQTDHESGAGGFASWNFLPQWSIFGRYDWATKRLHTPAIGPSMPNDYYNVGLEWNPIKIVDISLVYKHENERGNYADSNIAAGAATTTLTNYNEVGVFTQLRW